MSKVTVDDQVLTDIADAIRLKRHVATLYRPIDMALAINQINTVIADEDEGKVVSGGVLVEQTSATYTSNGTYNTTTKNSTTFAMPAANGVSF